MFEHWDSFYLLVGGAAGALIGLLFIVATLTRGRDRDSALHGASVYMSPVVLHLALVLAISALAAVPGIDPETGGRLVAVAGLIGVVASARVVYHLAIAKTFAGAHWTDMWCYGLAALAADLAMTGAASAVWWASTRAADLAIGASLVAILLIAIRNAWDLVTWISAVNNSESAASPDVR